MSSALHGRGRSDPERIKLLDCTSSPVPGLTRNIQKGEAGKGDRRGQKEIK